MNFYKILLSVLLVSITYFVSQAQFETITMDKNIIEINAPLNPSFVLKAATGPKSTISVNDTYDLQIDHSAGDLILTPQSERVYVSGLINVAEGDTSSLGMDVAGDIRFFEGIFQGYDGGFWRPFTTDSSSAQEKGSSGGSTSNTSIHDIQQLEGQVEELEETIGLLLQRIEVLESNAAVQKEKDHQAVRTEE